MCGGFCPCSSPKITMAHVAMRFILGMKDLREEKLQRINVDNSSAPTALSQLTCCSHHCPCVTRCKWQAALTFPYFLEPVLSLTRLLRSCSCASPVPLPHYQPCEIRACCTCDAPPRVSVTRSAFPKQRQHAACLDFLRCGFVALKRGFPSADALPSFAGISS